MSTADGKMGAYRTVLCPKQLSAGEGNYVLSHRDLNCLFSDFLSHESHYSINDFQ